MRHPNEAGKGGFLGWTGAESKEGEKARRWDDAVEDGTKDGTAGGDDPDLDLDQDPEGYGC